MTDSNAFYAFLSAASPLQDDAPTLRKQINRTLDGHLGDFYQELEHIPALASHLGGGKNAA